MGDSRERVCRSVRQLISLVKGVRYWRRWISKLIIFGNVLKSHGRLPVSSQLKSLLFSSRILLRQPPDFLKMPPELISPIWSQDVKLKTSIIRRGPNKVQVEGAFRYSSEEKRNKKYTWCKSFWFPALSKFIHPSPASNWCLNQIEPFFVWFYISHLPSFLSLSQVIDWQKLSGNFSVRAKKVSSHLTISCCAKTSVLGRLPNMHRHQ